MEVKFCKFCKEAHPLNEEWWHFGKKGCHIDRRFVCLVERKLLIENKRKKLNLNARRYRQKHPDICNDRTIQWRSKSQEYIKKYAKMYHEKNKDRDKASHKQWYKNNIEIIRSKANEKYKTDLHYRLKIVLRQRLRSAIKGDYKSGSAVRDLGCTVSELKKYLESRFQPKMSWENWGCGVGKWNIDHINPLCYFDLTDREQLLNACHFTNLQPLWQYDNCQKGVIERESLNVYGNI